MDSGEIRVEFGEPLGMQPLTPAPPACQPAQQQQQQTSVVMLNSSSPEPPPLLIQSFACHILLACCTFWCCGAAFGLAAFILAGNDGTVLFKVDQFHAVNYRVEHSRQINRFCYLLIRLRAAFNN